MLRLNLKKEPYWLDLNGEVSLLVHPLNTAIMNAAQSVVKHRCDHMRTLRAELVSGGGDVRHLPDLNNEDIRKAFIETELTKTLACGAIVAWKGVYNAEGTETVAVSDKNIEELMDIWFISKAFFEKYLSSLELLETEGNASRLAANGTSAVGLDTAKSATTKASLAAKAT